MADMGALLDGVAEALADGDPGRALQRLSELERVIGLAGPAAPGLAERLAHLRELAEAAVTGVADARAILVAARQAVQDAGTYDEAGEKTIHRGPATQLGRF
ncbi:hypothetical protein SAMN05421538_1037 [Paracoccus isoporae]|uniref:FlgN protein n=1 Tax=Paracoccus isoporae TaxID=591205 RepID=A0A1G6YKG1_9RHOB|nr:hypothetical protein [Paracoccus isoporae]SDD90792.1 hypothetical protein SAMN05421538_1037 [Paracoccus isoporae]